MNFEKALEAMKQGKKVRRASFVNEYWFYNFDFDRIIIYDGENFRDFGINPVSDIIDSHKDDWEIYEKPKQEEPEMTAEKAKKILGVVRAEAICHGMVFEHCSLEKFVAAIDFALEILKKQSEKENKVSQLAENAQKKQETANKCSCNCKIQPAKFVPDDMPTEEYIRKLAFDKFIAGLKFGLEIAKDSQKENKNNA